MNSYDLELHYHLKDQSHSMNAHIRNKCEAEALAAFMHIAEVLGLDLAIETSAYQEGGLLEKFRLLAKPEVTGAISLLSLLSGIIIPLWTYNPPDKELDAINKEVAKATLVEKELNNQKLKAELAKLSANEATKPDPVPSTTPSPELIKLTITVMQSDVKLIARRSNFYKALNSYDRVTGVGMRDLSTPTEPESFVKKSDFFKFILKTDKLDAVIVEAAVIEISAPVIDGSGMHWKGIYQGEPITFAMKDDAFKDSVARREVSFQHGNSILCVLEISRKIDAVGDVIVTGRSVTAVIEKIEGTNRIETPKGRALRFEKKQADSQKTLPFTNEPSDETSPHPDWGTY